MKVIQIDVCPEELHNNVEASIGIQSDLKPAVALLNDVLEKKGFKYSSSTAWWKILKKKCKDNEVNVQVRVHSNGGLSAYSIAKAESFRFSICTCWD